MVPGLPADSGFRASPRARLASLTGSTRRLRRALGTVGVVVALAVGPASVARAQEMEPRSYSNAPVGMNFLIGGYAYTRGGLVFDGALPVTDPELNTSSAVLAYARVLDILGQSARLSVLLRIT
jgi:hypothetical protein